MNTILNISKNKFHEVKFVSDHGTKEYKRTGGTAPLIPDLGTKRRSDVSLAPPAALNPGKDTRYPSSKSLAGPTAGLDVWKKGNISSNCRKFM